MQYLIIFSVCLFFVALFMFVLSKKNRPAVHAVADRVSARQARPVKKNGNIKYAV